MLLSQEIKYLCIPIKMQKRSKAVLGRDKACFASAFYFIMTWVFFFSVISCECWFNKTDFKVSCNSRNPNFPIWPCHFSGLLKRRFLWRWKFCSCTYVILGISAEIASNLPVTTVHLYRTNMPAENGNQTSNSFHGGQQRFARKISQ